MSCCPLASRWMGFWQLRRLKLRTMSHEILAGGGSASSERQARTLEERVGGI